MAVKEILLLGNPILRAKSEKVKSFDDAELFRIISDLKDTLENFRLTRGFGRGIAAPQIGEFKKIIFINIDKPIVLINPKIIQHSKQRMTLWDDCFSFPDIMVKVKRSVKVTVDFQGERGKKQILHATGDLSQLLQHEIDHLNGILAIDRAIDSKHIILRSEWNKIIHSEKDKYSL